MVTLDVIPMVVSIISVVIAAIAVIVSIISLRIAKKAQEPKFELNRRESIVEGSRTAIEVSHPDKPIEKCMVLLKDIPLVCDDNKDPNQHEKFIHAQGSALFRIPTSIEDEDVLVIVKDGKKTLSPSPIKLKDIHRS